jgi:phosphotransferase system HPr-like phosphotransfer protein
VADAVADVEVEVRNPSGLHARPAAVFVRAAARGNRIRIVATGTDADDAVAHLADLVAAGLGEETGDA